MPGFYPQNNKALVAVEKPNEKIGDIYLPEASQKNQSIWTTGIISALPPSLYNPRRANHLEVGRRVQFLDSLSIQIEGNDSEVLVNIEDIWLADLEEEQFSGKSMFNELGTWAEFSRDDLSDWEKLANIGSFAFQVDFIQPFQSLRELAIRLYEEVAQEVRSIEKLSLRGIEYSESDGRYKIMIDHDYWHCSYAISEKENLINLTINKTNIEKLHSTIERQFEPLRRLFLSHEFRDIAGKDYSRVSIAAFQFKQTIRILGQSSKVLPVKNSSAMEKFLYFKTDDKKAALDALGFSSEDLGRIDLKLGFDRKLAEHNVTIFLDIQAPANEEYRLLELNWTVQYPDPKSGLIRDYSHILTNFMRDIVLRQFYQSWLSHEIDLQCETERG